MRMRFGRTVGILLMLIGAVSLLAGAASETGTVTAGIVGVLDVTMPESTVAFGNITADVNGVTLDQYLELRVNSNVTYTVELSCSGNLQLQGAAANGVNEIETEYAIWKHVEWHDWYTQQGGAVDDADGWVHDDLYKWYDNPSTPYWYEAHLAADGSYGIQGGNSGTPEHTSGALAFPTGLLPEHWTGWTWWAGLTWDDTWYNHGSDLTLRFFPYLDVFEDYGTRAGNYAGTITVIVTSVNSSVP